MIHTGRLIRKTLRPSAKRAVSGQAIAPAGHFLFWICHASNRKSNAGLLLHDRFILFGLRSLSCSKERPMKNKYGKCKYCDQKAEMQFGFIEICRNFAEKPVPVADCLQFVCYVAGVFFFFCLSAWLMAHVATWH